METRKTVVRVAVLQSTQHAVCVAPAGDRERAAWLRRHEFEECGGADGDGLTAIRLSEPLALVRGLIERVNL